MPHERKHPAEAGPVSHHPKGNWHNHQHRPQEKKRLFFCLVLTTVTMVVEAVGGWSSGSLALLSDAGHMFTHAISLGISYGAIRLANRPVGSHRSFGWYRIEVIAALINGLLMFIVVAFIISEAIDRLRHPIVINNQAMLWIATLGLIVNLLCAFALASVRHHDLNVRSAFLHMLGDTLSSVGVVAAALIILGTGWHAIDPLLGLIIAGLIVVWGVGLCRDSINILLETAPPHLDTEQVINTICGEIPEIHQLHDVHIWEITAGLYAMTAHALTDDLRVSQTHQILERLLRLIDERFHITHANIQFEHDREGA